jgi:signal transduction histidine kinase
MSTLLGHEVQDAEGQAITARLEADNARLEARCRALEEELRAKEEELAAERAKLRDTRAQIVIQEKLASLGALTAGIVHEIRNPLNFVNNFAALSVDLADELRDLLLPVRGDVDADTLADVDDVLAELKENVGKIQEHGKRANSIVNGMLLHSREAGGKRAEAELNALVAESVHLAYHGMRAKDPDFNVHIRAEYDPAVGAIEMASADMSRVLLNVIHNACYATRDKKRRLGAAFAPALAVRTRDLGERVEIRVRDNGPGILPAVVGEIWTPFFTTKPPGEGTGLGLSISHDIVVQGHQGELRVETEPGEFTEFVITLPRRTAGSRPPSRAR